jgi:hypothetical protein
MPVNYNPKIVSAGLVASWDGGNLKSCDPRENLFLHSNTFNNAAWNQGQYIWTSGAIGAPDGTLTGWQSYNNSSGNFNFFSQMTTTSVGGIYTFSIYIKKLDFSIVTILCGINNMQGANSFVYNFDTDTLSFPFVTPAGLFINTQVVDAPNGWKRAILTFDSSVFATQIGQTIFNVGGGAYVGTGGNTGAAQTKSAYFWGSQLERNLSPSTYSATTTAQYAKSTTLTDVSGNGNNLTTQNYPAWSKDFGGFFRTQADGHWLGPGTAKLPLRNSQYTLSCWARFPTTWNSNAGYIALSDMASINFQANYLKNVSTPGIFANNWWANNLLTTGNPANIQLNQWFMVTATYDGNTRRIYGNTTQLGSDVPTQNHNVVNSSIRLARGWGNEWMIGDMGPAFIYNKGLSASEVTQNYNALKGRFGL